MSTTSWSWLRLFRTFEWNSASHHPAGNLRPAIMQTPVKYNLDEQWVTLCVGLDCETSGRSGFEFDSWGAGFSAKLYVHTVCVDLLLVPLHWNSASQNLPAQSKAITDHCTLRDCNCLCLSRNTALFSSLERGALKRREAIISLWCLGSSLRGFLGQSCAKFIMGVITWLCFTITGFGFKKKNILFYIITLFSQYEN